MRLDIAIFAVSLAIGVFFVGAIIDTSFWLDETATAIIASGGIRNAVFNTQPYTSHPPYYFIIAIWKSVFGGSEISLRLPSVIVSIHTLYLLVLISQMLSPAKSLLGRTMWISVGLLTNPSFLHLVWQARPYALGLWFSCVAIYALLLFANNHNSSRLFVSGLFSLWACLTSPFFAVLLGLEFVIALLWGYGSEQTRNIGHKMVIMVVTVFSLWALLYVLFDIYDLDRVSSSYDFLLNVSGKMLFVSVLHCIMDLSVSACIVLLLLNRMTRGSRNKFGFRDLLMKPKANRGAVLIVAWVFLPAVALAILCLIYQAYFGGFSRYKYLSVGGTAIGVGMLFEYFFNNRKKTLVTLVFVLLAVALCEGGVSRGTEQWREAASYIRHQLNGREGFVFVWGGHPESFIDQEKMSQREIRAFSSAAIVYGLDKISQIRLLFPAENKYIDSRYAQEILLTTVAGSYPVFLLLRAHHADEKSALIRPYKIYYESKGYKLLALRSFVGVTVAYFDKT